MPSPKQKSLPNLLVFERIQRQCFCLTKLWFFTFKHSERLDIFDVFILRMKVSPFAIDNAYSWFYPPFHCLRSTFEQRIQCILYLDFILDMDCIAITKHRCQSAIILNAIWMASTESHGTTIKHSNSKNITVVFLLLFFSFSRIPQPLCYALFKPFHQGKKE